MDELALYGIALDEDEVDDIYDYQAAWFDVSLVNPIIIDLDDPVVELEVAGRTIGASDNIVLAAFAYDATSAIESLQYTYEGSNGWQPATRDGEAWIFTFVPHNTNTNGNIIKLQATDSAGNSTQIQGLGLTHFEGLSA